MEKIRSFVAIELTEDVKDRLLQIMNEVRLIGAGVKWVERENLHLTLKFLGSVESSRLEEVKAALAKIAGEFTTFQFTVEGVGAFPSPSKPRVLWVGVRGGEEVMRLQGRVEEEMQRLGFTPEEKAYHPHVTIGRVKASQKIAETVSRLWKHEGETFGIVPVEEIALIRSDLTPSGSIYTPLARWRLVSR